MALIEITGWAERDHDWSGRLRRFEPPSEGWGWFEPSLQGMPSMWWAAPRGWAVPMTCCWRYVQPPLGHAAQVAHGMI